MSRDLVLVPPPRFFFLTILLPLSCALSLRPLVPSPVLSSSSRAFFSVNSTLYPLKIGEQRDKDRGSEGERMHVIQSQPRDKDEDQRCAVQLLCFAVLAASFSAAMGGGVSGMAGSN